MATANDAFPPRHVFVTGSSGSGKTSFAQREPLIRDASLRQRFGAVGRARFESEFVFETHLRRTWAIYLDVIEHGSAPVPRKLLGHLRTLRPSR